MSELLTVAQVAAVLKVSEDTVVRRFSRVKGVIDLGTGETRAKRRYRVLRIPLAVVEGHLAKLSGTTVKIELPDKAERRRKSASWINRAILNLAKAAKQNGCTDKRTLVRMAERARLLAVHVPEADWKECDWSHDLTDDAETTQRIRHRRGVLGSSPNRYDSFYAARLCRRTFRVFVITLFISGTTRSMTTSLGISRSTITSFTGASGAKSRAMYSSLHSIEQK